MHAGSCGRGATDRYTALRVGELGLFKGYREAFGVVHLAGGSGWPGWKWSLGGGEVCDMLARPPGSPSTPPGPIIFDGADKKAHHQNLLVISEFFIFHDADGSKYEGSGRRKASRTCTHTQPKLVPPPPHPQ